LKNIGQLVALAPAALRAGAAAVSGVCGRLSVRVRGRSRDERQLLSRSRARAATLSHFVNTVLICSSVNGFVHPHRQASAAAALHDARRECYDRCVISAKRLPPPDFYGRLESIHLGHLAIHKDETVAAVRVPVERLPAVDCGFRLPNPCSPIWQPRSRG